MPRAPRSVKQQMDIFSAELRERGCTWAEVAAEFQRRWHLNSRQGFREAHRLTQAKVCHLWNEYWPNEPLTTRKLGSWEAWPGPTGNEPPIAGLNRLARIYHCRTADLVDGEDHRDADEHNAPAARLRGRELVAAGAAGSLCHEDIQGVLATLPALPAGPAPVGSTREEEYDALVRALAQWAASMNRRDVLALVRAAAAAAAASPLLDRLNDDELDRLALIAAEPSRVDQATVDHIDAVLHHCMRQEDSLGPQSVLGTVLAQQHLVRSLIPAASTDEVRERLLYLLANICRFTAWVLFNLNDFNGANYYYEQAKSAAHRADNDAMNSFVLANWSQLATWQGDPRQGVEHALGALAWGQRAGSKLLVSYACDVGARAYSAVLRRSAKTARHKDHARCMRSLDRALRELGHAGTEDVGGKLLYFYGDGQYLSTKTKCLLDMGDAQAAVEMAARSLARIDPTFVRNLAFSRLDLARAHLRLRAIDEACEHIGEAARLTCRNTSPRLARSVVEIREALNPWARTRQVAALDEKLHALQLIA
ncbi:hypothetical protein ABT061_29915 [Streptosporangium sp. NPDC002544]|uniref:hypothetical protein n=1 Tax=Streptosporangium sp. NPDC002544 TaxID=3154538 RepID=UPI0033312C68